MSTTRRSLTIACLGLSLASAIGCSSESSTSLGEVDAAAVASTSPGADATAATPQPTEPSDLPTTPSTTAPLDDIDAPQVLDAALSAVAPGYHFVTTAQLGGAEVVSAEGERIAERTRLSVASNGATVDYVVAPEGAWASIDGGWKQLDQPPITDPLTPLRAPETLSAVTADGSTVTLAATYAPTALSLTGEEPVTVHFTIVDGQLQTISYEADTANGLAQVAATISPLTDSTPIELPAA